MNDGKIHIPGSKYIANRVLLLSALTEGTSVVSNVPHNQDISILERALVETGAGVKELCRSFRNGSRLEIQGINAPGSRLQNRRKIDVGESGTLLRFALGFACLLQGKTVITAASRNRERPVEPLISALKDLGASVLLSSGGSIYPITVTRGLAGGRTVISGEFSSQFISSLLIVSPYAAGDVEIKVMKPIVSSGYIDVTIREMKKFGVTAERTRKQGYDLFTVQAGQKYQPRKISIPMDWSSANYLIAASVILNRELSISGIDAGSNPGESEFVFILQRMGCRISANSLGVSVHRQSRGGIRGVQVDMKDSPDSVLTLIAVALFAEGTTTISNISHLIYKESDRIGKTEIELRKTGADITTTGDSIVIVGSQPLHRGVTQSHNDHRLAMCLGLVKLLNPGMEIQNSQCVNKSFPGFWECIGMIEGEGGRCLEIQ